MKGIVRIGGALAVGVVIILSALYVKDASGTSQVGGAIVAKAPERTYIESQDSDNDGIKDWEETLENSFIETVYVSSTTTDPSVEEYTPPTTFTGRFSEAFFQDYLQGKMSGADFSDPSSFIGGAVTAIEKNTGSATHSRSELHIISSSPESIRAYGNELARIIKKNSIDNENEMVILERALKANDPSLLVELKPIEEVYTRTIQDTLLMQVPDSVALQHIAFLNASEAILTDVRAMQIAFDDPLYALARTKGYEADATLLYNSFVALSDSFDEEGVTFTSEEAGIFFYLFDI